MATSNDPDLDLGPPEEAGVRQLQELYERIEAVYALAAAAASQADVVYSSDSTTVMIADAHLGSDTQRA